MENCDQQNRNEVLDRIPRANSYSTTIFRFLAVGRISGGCVHTVWRTTENSVVDVRKAVIKTRMSTGTYILQKNVHTFSQYQEDPTCKLCKQQEEDICHMLLYCPLLREDRNEPYTHFMNTIIRYQLYWCGHLETIILGSRNSDSTYN